MKITTNYPKYAGMGFFSKELKNEFEPAVVNEPSVFDPFRFYCIYIRFNWNLEVKLKKYKGFP